jgi:microtubule-associated protein-like 6
LEVLILDSISLAVQHKFKDTSKKVDDLTFSPGNSEYFRSYILDGRFLAVGNHDDDINVYFLEQEYKKIGSCKGHSAHITHLDWSEDSKVMQSDSGSYEHLFCMKR